MHDRYHRQAILGAIGADGQARIGSSRAVVVGCGALGCVSAQWLARAGVGELVVVDRDIVELTNLQRQVLFTEADAREGAPKADAARRALERINSAISIRAVVADLDHENVGEIVEGADVIVDGTDNAPTRYLLNDIAVRDGSPMVYAGVVGTGGVTMTIAPGLDEQTACLRCVFPDPPDAGALETCDTAGVLGPAVGVIASMQAGEAMKILAGRAEAVRRSVMRIDLWDSSVREVRAERDEDCPCCGDREFEFLDGKFAGRTVKLCGRGAVQVHAGSRQTVDLGAIEAKLGAHGDVIRNELLVRALLPAERTDAGDTGCELTVFADGRAIVKGTERAERARSIYAKYVGL